MPDFTLEVTYVSRTDCPYNGIANGDFTEETLIAGTFEAMLEVLNAPPD